MAYNNDFFYNRDNSVDNKYKYIYDFSLNFDPVYYLQIHTDVAADSYYSTRPYEHYINFGIKEKRSASPNITNLYKPIYGSSVDFDSRLNFLQTVDNTLKVIPASENNLTVTYNLKFLLTDNLVGCFLKTIEIAGNTKILTFPDPSNMYNAFSGFAGKYSVNKVSTNLSEFNIIINNYGLLPQASRYSVLIKDNIITTNFLEKLNSKPYRKHSIYLTHQDADSLFPYIENNTFNYYNRNLTFVNSPLQPRHNSQNYNLYLFAKDEQNLTRNFYFQTKYPFVLENEIDVYKMDFKNSFIQNVKYKDNTNVLKQFSLRFENITTDECTALLFFLEKKFGYKRFIYEFPIFMKKHKVFICNKWSHVFKYDNCHDVTVQLIEDPNPIIIYPSTEIPSSLSFMNEPILPS